MGEYKGFIGATYQTRSAGVSADRCVNWQPEIVPAGEGGKTGINYYPTPGLIQHAAPALGAGRGAFALNGRQFAVLGASFVEFLADGTFTAYGGLFNDGTPVSIVANAAAQIAIASGGNGYIFDSGANTLTLITGGVEPDGVTPGTFNGVSMFAFLETYLIALNPNSKTIQIATNGLNWSALNVSANLGSADNLVAIITAHEYLYQCGSKRIAIYYNAGNADFPIIPVSGAFIEQGVKAPASLKRGDNTIFWLGANENGADVVYRANGFIPTRISTHAVEAQWAKYSRTDDATAYFVQRQGHNEYRITFPSGDATWVYDLATSMWHERASFDSPTGTMHAQTQRFHCYSGGVHYLVGIDGVIYREDLATFTEAGRPIKRLRIAPAIYNANKHMFVTRLEIVIEPGVGLDGDPAAQGAAPLMVLRYSGDSGRTWSNEMTAGGGAFGDPGTRVVFDQLGSGRSWVPELSTTDPNNWVLVGAEVEVIPGNW